jgi:sulfate adenylyltransferase subunit 1
MNGIAPVTIKTIKPFMVVDYRDNRIPGSFILIDDSTYETVVAGMII